MSAPDDASRRGDHRRVALALALCEESLPPNIAFGLQAEIAQIVIGWAVLAAGANLDDSYSRLARDTAESVGERRTRPIETHAMKEQRARIEVEAAKKAESAAKQSKQNDEDKVDEADASVAEGFVRVCSLSDAERKNPKLKDIVRGHEHVIGVDVPLAATPDLRVVRAQLLFEFPYAEAAIDFILADLVGRDKIRLRPVLLLGKPGGGKSRLARRLGETLGVGVWRTDASQSDGSVFGGTAKRWYSAEAAHPFLAISRARQANPLIVVDEVEKAGTRSDYGKILGCFARPVGT